MTTSRGRARNVASASARAAPQHIPYPVPKDPITASIAGGVARNRGPLAANTHERVYLREHKHDEDQLKMLTVAPRMTRPLLRLSA